MSNALFLLDNAVDVAQIAASSAVATGPVTNIQNQQRTRIWRSGFGSASYLQITLASAVTTSHVAIVDVNLTVAGTIRVRAWTDAIGGATLVADVTLTPGVYTDPLQPLLPYGQGNFNVGTFGAFSDYAALNTRNVTLFTMPANITARYWQIDFSDSNTSYQQCGRVVMSNALVFTNNLDYSWTGTREERSSFRESLGGQIYSQPRDSRLHLAGSFDYLTDSERTTMLKYMQRFGFRRPLIYSMYPENTDQGLTTTMYGRFVNASVSGVLLNQNKFPFEIAEAL